MSPNISSRRSRTSPIGSWYGHKTGDDLLRAVAAAIRNRLRASDTAARIGGDEFAVLLLNASVDEGAAVAMVIGQAVADATIEAGDTLISVTASIGTSVLNKETLDAETAFGDADTAMYLEKARNDRMRTVPSARLPRRLSKRRSGLHPDGG